VYGTGNKKGHGKTKNENARKTISKEREGRAEGSTSKKGKAREKEDKN